MHLAKSMILPLYQNQCAFLAQKKSVLKHFSNVWGFCLNWQNWKYVLAKQNHYLKAVLKITPTCQSQLKFPSQLNSLLHFVCEIGKFGFDYKHMQKELIVYIYISYIFNTVYNFPFVFLFLSFIPCHLSWITHLFVISVHEQFNYQWMDKHI